MPSTFQPKHVDYAHGMSSDNVGLRQRVVSTSSEKSIDTPGPTLTPKSSASNSPRMVPTASISAKSETPGEDSFDKSSYSGPSTSVFSHANIPRADGSILSPLKDSTGTGPSNLGCSSNVTDHRGLLANDPNHDADLSANVAGLMIDRSSGAAPTDGLGQEMLELRKVQPSLMTAPSKESTDGRGLSYSREKVAGDATVCDKAPLLTQNSSASSLSSDGGDGAPGDQSPGLAIAVAGTPGFELDSVTDNESSLIIALQVFLPFLVAGVGMVAAGLVLDTVQHWPVFVEVSEIFILVPALLGLKGNLEMTLASRLSTQANLGRMDSRADKLTHIGGNLALTQAQALVVAFLASGFAIALGWVPKGEFNVGHAFLLCASSMTTAAVASFTLGSIMIAVVIAARHFKINPDNVATPIAASLGDITTLVVLAWIGSVLNHAKIAYPWLAPTIVCFWAALIPLWFVISLRNKFIRPVIIDGWTPVVAAMLISSAGGFILDLSVARFHGIAVFQPVINGVGGNLVAVQASRLSTWLHGSRSPMGKLPRNSTFSAGCPNPLTIFLGPSVHSRAARVLLFMVIPGHLIFVFLINALQAGHTTITPIFTCVYLTAAVIQVAVLLYVCVWMVHSMWSREVDPDNSAIPYLTALGDLLGTGLLAISFWILFLIGDQDSDVDSVFSTTTGSPGLLSPM